jgi:hypothetical protein
MRIRIEIERSFINLEETLETLFLCNDLVCYDFFSSTYRSISGCVGVRGCAGGSERTHFLAG